MIEFNKILNPRLVGPLVRIFAMKTGGSPAPTLAPEVAPSFDVNQQDDISLSFLRQERLQWYYFGVGAAVGQNAMIRLRNPANSGSLLLIERLTVFSGAALQLFHGVGVQTADLTTVASSAPRDIRWISSGGSRGVAVVSQETNAAPTAPSGGLAYSSVAGSVWSVPVVLPPGSAWTLYAGTANTSLFASLEWKERPIQAEELSTG